ncbi:MAG: virulence protein [Clostridia bacterium]|nr:virulence protein [Clostridia bacterium]
MKVVYNITNRKPFVKALEEITGTTAVYKFTPTYAFEVGYFTVTREGNLTFNDMADPDETERVLEALRQRGFQYESSEYDSPQPEIDEPEPLEDCPPAYGTPDSTGLMVSLPLDKVSTVNLTNLLDAKSTLIKKALGIDATPIVITEETISFPWFSTLPEPDEVSTYTNFIAALCKMSKDQIRISAIEKTVDNEKYAFRCFLLRLGFIGDEYKTERKILLRRLSGNSAFKGGEGHAISE